MWFCRHTHEVDLVEEKEVYVPLVLAGSAPEELRQGGNSVEVAQRGAGRRGEGLSEDRRLQRRQTDRDKHQRDSRVEQGFHLTAARRRFLCLMLMSRVEKQP